MSVWNRVKHCSLFANENRVLRIVLPITLTLALWLGFALWNMNLIVISNCGYGCRIRHRSKSICKEATALKRSFQHSQETVNRMTDKAAQHIARNKYRNSTGTLFCNVRNAHNGTPLPVSTTNNHRTRVRTRRTSHSVYIPSDLTIKRHSSKGNSSSKTTPHGRSRKEIYRTIRNNSASLKYSYIKRKKVNTRIGNTIELNWFIDEYGNVLQCKVVSSTLNDPDLEKTIVRKVRSWAFGNKGITGDTTEVTYPFVFDK